MKDLNRYVEARREWNDRYLDLVRARRWWQVAAVSELALIATLGSGLIALSLQHKTVPYVVEVDSLGAAVAVKPADSIAACCTSSAARSSSWSWPDSLRCAPKGRGSPKKRTRTRRAFRHQPASGGSTRSRTASRSPSRRARRPPV